MSRLRSFIIALAVTSGIWILLAWIHIDRIAIQVPKTYSTHFYKRYVKKAPAQKKKAPIKKVKKKPKKIKKKPPKKQPPPPQKQVMKQSEITPPKQEIEEQQDVTDISELDQEAVVVKPITPKYPKIAQKAGIEGQVILEIIINEKGRVIDAKVLHVTQKGFDFEKNALEAVRKLYFEPFIKEGEAIKVKVIYPIQFVLIE